MCHADSNWVDSLPLVMLGIRSAFKDDLKSSPAELVYGEPLRLPGEFFQTTTPPNTDISDFTTRLWHFASKIRPAPASRHIKEKIFIFKNLSTSSHVFLRDDSLRGALQPPYSGPYKVLERGEIIFNILIKGKSVTVSIDHLKPAYTLIDTSPDPISTKIPNIQQQAKPILVPLSRA
nr:uncharacterized protein LOC116775561 [Danaus plexippus plexippus]